MASTRDDAGARRVAAAFARFAATRDPRAFAEAFDGTAQDLLLVAARLCRRAGSAEDLLQDTWLHAIRRAHAYDPARPLLPWLIGILVKQVRMARRSRARAAARESGDPTEPRLAEDGDAPGTAAAGAELHEDLAAALAELDERLRSVLVLRLVHGLTSVEIGRVLGRAPDTVRVQLARGLDRLRRLLPPGHALPAVLVIDDGVRLALVREALLENLASDAVRAGAGTVAASAAIGVLAMQKVLLVGAAAVLGVVAGLWSWSRSADSPADGIAGGEPPAPLAGVTAPSSADAARSDIDEAGQARRAAAFEAPAASSAMVLGRCVDEVGQPLRDVTVTVTDMRGRSDAPPVLPAQVTGSDGRFSVVLADLKRLYRVALATPGRASRQGSAWHDAAAMRVGGVYDLGDLVLPWAAPIRGRLVGRDSRPVRIAAGEIRARAPAPHPDRWETSELQWGKALVSDSDSFVTAPLPAGAWRLILVAKGWFATPVTVMHGAAGSDVVLRVEEVPPLRGVVVDQLDRPLPGIQVLLDVRRRLEDVFTVRVATGVDGSFTLPSDGFYGTDHTVTVIAHDTNNRYASCSLEARFGGPDLRFVLTRLGSLSVKVVDADTGKPVAGAHVGWSESPTQTFVTRCVQAPQGVAVLAGLPAAPITVSAIGPGGEHRIARAEAVGVVRDAPGGEADLVLRLQPAPVLAVRVVQGDTGVAGAKVELLDPLGRNLAADTQARTGVTTPLFFTPDTVLCLGSATTDGSGMAIVPQLDERVLLAMRVSGKGIPTTILHAPFGRGTGRPGDPIVCVICRGGTVAVRLVGASDLGLANLLLARGEGATRQVHPDRAAGVAPDAGGVVTFENVPPGVWGVHVQRAAGAFAGRGWPLPLANVTVLASKVVHAEADLRPLRPARLDLTLAADVDGMHRLECLSSSAAEHTFELRAIGGRIATDFELFPGRYRLVRMSDGAAATFDLRPGEVRSAPLDLQGRR